MSLILNNYVEDAKVDKVMEGALLGSEGGVDLLGFGQECGTVLLELG